jgi:hypothetical protein
LTKPLRDKLLVRIEREVTDLLEKRTLSNAERLKAIEVGAKVLMIRHKLEDVDGKDGAFFSKK